MKHLIKILSLGLFIFGLANCGSSGGGTPPSPPANVAKDATDITFTAGSDTISWNETKNNIYTTSNQADCVFGLSSGAIDSNINDRIQELHDLVNQAKVGKGKNDTAGANSNYLTITYKDGKIRTFNLNNDQASTSEEILSNGAQIIEFFDDVANDLDQSGFESCDSGKGNK